MNKILILAAVVTVFLTGCKNVDNPQRIDGIINAVYTNYEIEKNLNKSKFYLQQKVKNEEISELTSTVIEKCLKRSFSKWNIRF